MRLLEDIINNNYVDISSEELQFLFKINFRLFVRRIRITFNKVFWLIDHKIQDFDNFKFHCDLRSIMSPPLKYSIYCNDR